MKRSKWLLVLMILAALLVGMAVGAGIFSARYEAQLLLTEAELDAARQEADVARHEAAQANTALEAHLEAAAEQEKPEPEPEPEAEPEPEPEPATEPEPESTAEELRMLDLQTELDAVIAELDSKWGVYVEDLTGDCTAECYRNVDGDTPMVSASLIKLFVMGTVYQQIEDGLLEETDSLTQDMIWMITISDNGATNRLIALLGGGDAAAGMELVNQWSADIGCEHTELNRLMLDNNGLQNYTTVRDCGLILGLIYRGQCVSESRSAQMLELLCGQQVTHKIPAGITLPVEQVGSKTGELSGIAENDVAIVFAEQGDYILCVMANDPYSNSGAGEVIRQLSGLACDALLGGK